MKKYAATHEWLEIENGIATVGISSHAADEMGDLTYVELPELGKAFKSGEAFGSVESVKAASEIFAPLSGTVCEVNTALEESPESLNDDPEGRGWICRFNGISEADLESLMTLDEYLASL